jgi:molecular chaperone DnaJ
MMAATHAVMKNYYLILGVPRGESYRGIRAAYRDLAKKFHPDRAGPRGKAAFQELVEAYQTLSDPARRREYNLHIDREAERAESGEPAPGAAPSEGELLVPEPIKVVSDPESVGPSLEAMYERFLRNFTHIGVPKSERAEGLNIEVVLTPEEAMRGGVLPLVLPVFETCPECQGSGRDWGFACFSCGGQGVIERERTVRVRIPPMVKPRTIFEVPLQSLGIRNFYLRFHLRVDR